jgi:hypothetical protein
MLVLMNSVIEYDARCVWYQDKKQFKMYAVRKYKITIIKNSLKYKILQQFNLQYIPPLYFTSVRMATWLAETCRRSLSK